MPARTFASGVWTGVGGPLAFANNVWTGFGGPLVFAGGSWNTPSSGGGMELDIDFTSKSNGAMPSTFDTGQALTTTWNTTSAAIPVISGGRYVINATDNSTQAGYITTTLAGDVTYMECDFNWTSTPTGSGQAVALVAWRDPMPSGALSAISAQGSPAHVIFAPNYWAYQYFPPETGPVTTPDGAAVHTYATPFTDTRTHHVTVAINKAASQITITGSDGIPVTLSYSYIGSLTGTRACCEIFYTNASTDRRIQISRFKASSVPVAPTAVAEFLFDEGSGNAISNMGPYTLVPAAGTSWDGSAERARGPFTGSLGLGPNAAIPDWSVSFSLITGSTGVSAGQYVGLICRSTAGLHIDWTGTNAIEVFLGATAAVTPANSVVPGGSYRVAITHTGGTAIGAVTKIYINGAEAVSTTAATALPTAYNPAQLTNIGQGPGDVAIGPAAQYAYIDDIRTWDVALTAAQVAAVPGVVVVSPPPATDTFPKLSGMLIGGGQNYDQGSYQAQIAKLDMAILQTYKGWTKSGKSPATAINEIKALNPDILLGNYTLMTECTDNTAQPATVDVHNKLLAEDGPGGVGDWWARDSAGNHTDWAGGAFGSWDTNLTLLTTPDGNGDRFPQWLAKRDNTYLVSLANYDIWYSDNNMWKPRSDPDWNRDGTNDSQNGSTAQNWWRNGQRAYYDTAKTLQPTKLLMVNADNDLDGGVFPGGQSYTQFTGVAHGAFLEHIIGLSWSRETGGGWAGMMGWYHRVFQNLLAPKIVQFEVDMSASTTDYQKLRYGFGACLMNDGYFATSNGYGVVLWYDEYDLAGTATTKWLGAPLDPPQTTPWSLGVYRRRFENGMVLVNPKANGSRTVTPDAGYRRFSGSQAPSVNNGATVTGSVTLADRDGLFLVKI